MRHDGIRLGLGLAALLLVGLAAWAMLATEHTAAAGVAARSGILLGAAWFAYPAVRAVSGRALAACALAAAAVVATPRLAIVALPVAVLVTARRGRR